MNEGQRESVAGRQRFYFNPNASDCDFIPAPPAGVIP